MGSINQLADDLLALEARREREPLDPAEDRRRKALLRQLLERLREHPPKGKERRRYLRVASPLQVRFRTGEATLTAHADEMGLGGLTLRDHMWVIAGQQLTIESIRVADQSFDLSVKCRVVWRVSADRASPCAGLEFVGLDSGAKTQIRQIFEALFVAHIRDAVAAGKDLASGGTQDDPAGRDEREGLSVPSKDEEAASGQTAGWLEGVKKD